MFPLAIGGYKYDERTKTFHSVFIDYDIDENSFNRDYTHGFLPDNDLLRCRSREGI